MEIIYYGTGAAEGIPAVFCHCEYCTGVRARKGREIRSRSQVILDGELSVDFPPDVFYHGALLGAPLDRVRYLLVTHSHMDHFYAQDFILRGYKFARDVGTLDIFANAEVIEVFREGTRREMREEVADAVRLHEIRAFEPICFGDWRVFPLKAKHSSQNPLVYLIERGNKRVLHLTDTGFLPEESLLALEKYGGKPYDLITFDCTFLYHRADEKARHMGLHENLCLYARLREKGLADEHTVRVITHFSHNSAPTQETLERAEREFQVTAAYDGMTVTV